MSEHQTSDHQPYSIRQPEERDAENIIAYSKIVFSSTDQLLTLPEEYTITPEAEKIWISMLTQNPNAFVVIAELDRQIAGLLFFIPSPKKKNSHVGEFGVTVHPKFQRVGIGRELIKALLHWAKNNAAIEKVTLNVFATNQNAIDLYKDLGFIEEGRFIKAVKQTSGEYIDTLQMYIETK